ncbi:hypothetical protein LguiA_033048 [Lonicera macranthoides]
MLILLVIFSSLINQAFCTVVDPFHFLFPSFDSNSCSNDSDLICLGSVTASNGSISLTPENLQGGSDPGPNRVGRVLYRHPILVWPASFTTSFTFSIGTNPNVSGSGDGIAFIIAQDDRPSPPQSYGSFLGILDPSTQGGALHQLAIELDTYKNEQEKDGNHIAIDTTSVTNPIAHKSLTSIGINLKSGREITLKITYDGWSKRLKIYISYANETLISFLNKSIIMKNTVPRNAFVGFTASTSPLSETCCIFNWNFTSYELPEESLKRQGGSANTAKVVVMALIPAFVGLMILVIFAYPIGVRALKRRSERNGRRKDIETLTRNAANVPRIFSYRQLVKATSNFSKENLLGSGGFGSVYKGVLVDPPSTVAVKKISATSTQGEKEYLAEICTIGRLRHKNLVQLQGWCHDHDQLLLVYDYMPNGSLDKFIGKAFMNWKTRYNILQGLASVLVYLHEECGNPVVHRDVKPNNIMLDSDYNAHLGDFGLARMLQNGASVITMVAGTPGYLAPEVSYTGRATPESDVYSFGMVVLEVVCGRRSRGIMEENSLVDFVWGLYEKGDLLKCVEQRLGNNFDEEQVKRTLVVGLACLHPDFLLRPKMRKVVQIFLNPEETLVKLPEFRPSAVCLSFHSSSCSTTTDFGSTKAFGSMESLPDEMTVIYDS